MARTCDRTPGEPGIFPLDAQVNLPERCYSSFLQEWMTVFAVEHPFQESAGLFAQLFDLDVAESVLMEVAQEAPADDEGFYAQRPVPPEDSEGELLVVSFDGKGVPMIKAEAVKLKAKLGTGEKRQKKKEALVGVSYTVDPKPRSPEALAELLVEPEAARARRRRADTTGRDTESPAGAACGQPGADEAGGDGADQGRRGAPGPPAPQTLGRPARWRPRPVEPGDQALRGVEACDVCPGHHARRRLPLERGQRACSGKQSKAGKHWVQQKLTAMLRGRVGYVIGGLRQILTKQRLRQSVRQTLAKVITFLHNHRRWMKYDQYLARGLPVGTGVVESACGSVVKHRSATENHAV